MPSGEARSTPGPQPNLSLAPWGPVLRWISMNTCHPRRSSCLALLPVLVVLGFADHFLEAQNRRRRRPPEAEERRQSPPAEEREAVDELIEKLVRKIETRPSSISSVISAYNDVERKSRLSLDSRYRLHKRLLDVLRDVDDPALARAAASVLRAPSKTKSAGQVLMMKAVVGEKFPAPREKRIEWLVRAVKGKHFPLVIWGLRLLGEAGWPEAVDALITVVDEEEAKLSTRSLLWQLASGELYRVLGGRTAYATTAGEIRAEWERRGRKVPEKPEYSLDALGDRPRATAAFFGDQISPRSVFLIDVSGSMKQIVTLRPPRSSRTEVAGEADRGERFFGITSPKIEIVKQELERAVGALQPVCEFNILRYSDRARPWRTVKGKLELVEASPKSVASATEFARGLRSESGTNIYEALDEALGVPDVDTIYLLSDGAPSVGGGVEAIERNVARKNYLKGARIVTYGFAPERRGLFVDDRFSFDEPFMKRVAANNWGWYRRLNNVTKREEDDKGTEPPRRRRRRFPR